MTELHGMVDVETTGFDPQCNAVIQFALTSFTINGTILLPDISINVFPQMPTLVKRWNKQTKQFHIDHNTVALKNLRYGTFTQYQWDVREIATKINDIKRAAKVDTIWFWCNHTHFDWPFVEQMFNEAGICNPFKYNYTMDLSSYVRGLIKAANSNRSYSDVQRMVNLKGNAHDAAFDVKYQLEILRTALRLFK